MVSWPTGLKRSRSSWVGLLPWASAEFVAAKAAVAVATCSSSRRPRLIVLSDLYLALGRPAVLVVVGPDELERAALLDLHEEGHEGIGRDRRVELHVQHRLVVVGDLERIHDLARDDVAGRVLALAVLHRMGDQGLDLDHFALLGGGRHAQARLDVVSHDFLLSRRSRRW